MKLLLDTTFLIDLEQGNPEAKAILESLHGHELCISTISANEFFIGASLSVHPDARKNASMLLNRFRLLVVDAHAALAAAALEAYFIAKGAPREKEDLLIAMTAVTYGCDALVTTNTRHFAGIDALKGKVKTPQEIG